MSAEGSGRGSEVASAGRGRLIFTVTTGRSGTNLLQQMFDLLDDVVAEHEPEPKFSRVLRDVQRRPEAAREWLERVKLPAIAAVAGRVYVETSHLCGKGFLEPLLGCGVVPDLVILRRQARAVARSLFQLGTIPARTETGRNFLLQPDDPGVLPVPGWADLHDYQLCYWYCLEMERRARLYPEMVRARGGRVSEVTFAELLTDGFPRIVRELDLESTVGADFLDRLTQARSTRVNDKADLKHLQSRVVPDNLDALEADVRARVGVDADFAA